MGLEAYVTLRALLKIKNAKDNDKIINTGPWKEPKPVSSQKS